MKVCTILIILFCLQSCQDSKPKTGPAAANTLEKIIAGDLQNPWEILWGPDNFIWMTERDGRVSRVDPSSGKLIPVYSIPDVQGHGEGGLLGMALHPQFANNPFVYVAYDY